MNKIKRREQFKDDLNLFTKSINKLIYDETIPYKVVLPKAIRIWDSVMKITPIVKSINKKGKYKVSYFSKPFSKRNKGVAKLFSIYVETLNSVIGRQRTEDRYGYERVNKQFTASLANIIKKRYAKKDIEKSILRFKNLNKSTSK